MDMREIIMLLVQVLELYTWILIARILLSWLPNIDWYRQPWSTLDGLTEPVMAPFRRLVPPIGMIDISPMVLFLVLNLLIRVLSGFAGGV